MALTRTQVGRDSLRAEIERQFNNYFKGEIRIGQLDGNLLNTLYARNILLLDENEVLVGSVESAIIRPKWYEIFSRTVSLDGISLYQPEFDFLYRGDSTWNIVSLFSPEQRGVQSPPWAFSSADIRIINGVLNTRSELTLLPELIANETIFDYANTSVVDLQSRLVIDWDDSIRFIEFNHLSGRLDTPSMNIDKVEGQFVWLEDGLDLTQVEIIFGTSRLLLDGTFEGLSQIREAPDSTLFDFSLNPSEIQNQDIKTLFPRYQVTFPYTVAANIQGPINNLTIERLDFSNEQLELQLNGLLRGLPDSLNYDLRIENSRLNEEAIALFVPPNHPVQLSEIRDLSLTSRGRIRFEDANQLRVVDLEGSATFRNGPGIISSIFRLQNTGADSVSYMALAEVDSLDLGYFLRDQVAATQLDGTIQVRGNLSPDASPVMDLDFSLSTSQLATITLDTLAVRASLFKETVLANGSATFNEGGSVSMASIVDLSRPQNPFRLSLETQQLDAGVLLGNDAIGSDLNMRIEFDGKGSNLDQLRGLADIQIQPSTIHSDDHTASIEEHAIALSFEDINQNRQFFKVSSDQFDFSANGFLRPSLLTDLVRYWHPVLQNRLRKETQKQRKDALAVIAEAEGEPFEDVVEAFYLENLQNNIGSALANVSTDSTLQIRFESQIRDASLINALLPETPDFKTDTYAIFDLVTGPKDFTLTGIIDADSIVTHETALYWPGISIDLAGTLDELLYPEVHGQFDLVADSIVIRNQLFEQPTLHLDLTNSVLGLQLDVEKSRRAGKQELVATLNLLEDKNQLLIDHLLLSLGNSQWSLERSGPIDLYENALVLPEITLATSDSSAQDKQRILISGALSDTPTDTAFVDIKSISLRPVSDFLEINPLLGGLMEGRLAYTREESQPRVTGRVSVSDFSMDNRLLGNLAIDSRFIPGKPDVGLEINLIPDEPPTGPFTLVDAPINGIYEENQLALFGTFRLPRLDAALTAEEAASQLDLKLDIARADVFFFEYIFPNLLENTEGYLEGNGSVTGSLSRPVFDVAMQLVKGRVDIPRFGLSFSDFEGPLRVDREGIHVSNLTLNDTKSGSASLDGSFLFNDYRIFSFDITGALNEMTIMNVDQSEELPFYGNIAASGNLSLTGPSNDAYLRADDAVTTPSSELYIPVVQDDIYSDAGYIIFADSNGNLPDLQQIISRRNVLSQRPEGERRFVDGLSMDLNIFAPPGSSIHLVFDPLLDDIVNAQGSGRIEIQRHEGEISTYGTLNIASGDYLFTAGELFARRFLIEEGGTISWDGDPIDARLNIPASYRTRASTAGLSGPVFDTSAPIPLIVNLDISGQVSTPQVELSLQTDRSDRNFSGNYEGIEAILNQSAERSTDYATSVLLTNSFLLTTDAATAGNTLTNSGNQLAFSSVSQMVASQVNRFLNQAIPNMDLNLGLQGENLQNPDVTYGVSLYLLDERLIIRGQGIYQNEIEQNQPGLEGEFTVEARLGPNVSMEVFLRREGDVLAEYALTSTRGAGLSYRTQFSSWRKFFNRLFGWMRPKKSTEDPLLSEKVTDEEEK